jgi:4-amino-4-deoxy-L-arabinose transferase-like glycosyltransferase
MSRTQGRNNTHRIILLLLFLAGAAIRLYYVQAHSSYMQSDEALVGLEAKRILTRGQFPIFDYGEERGGALFDYIVAPFFALFGVSNLVFKAVATVVSLFLVYLIYILARRVGGDRVGLLALAFAALAPPFFIMWSVHGAAEYLIMMVFGTAALVLGDDIVFSKGLDRPPPSPLRHHLTHSLLGLVMGIALWASPLAISFVAAVWIVLFLHDRRCFFRTTFLAFLLGLFVGSLPVILFNTIPEFRAASGLADSSNWVSYTSLFSAGGSLWSSFKELPATLVQVARVSLPIVLGGSLWEYETGWPRRLATAVLMGFWIVAVLFAIGARLRFWSGDEGNRRWTLTSIDAPLLMSVLAVLVFTLSQYRWLVSEPRYLLPIFALLPIAGALFIDWLVSQKLVFAYPIFGVVLALSLATTIWFSPSLDPDHGLWPKDEKLLDYLVDQVIQHPIADFWIAYSTAFETDEQVIPVPISYYKFGFYEEVLAQPLSTQYIFPKREKDDPYFDYFRYGLAGRQWSTDEFVAYLRSAGVPNDAYAAEEFDHYVLYDVPRPYLDPELISAPPEEIPADLTLQASQYLSDAARPGDAVILNPPDLAAPLSGQEPDGVRVYLVPERIPFTEAVTGERLARIAGEHRRLLAVFGDTSASDPEGFVEGWLDEHTFRAAERWVGDLRLVLYGTSSAPLAEEPSNEEGVLLGYSVELTGADLAVQRLEPGDVVPLTLFWQARQPVQQDAKVFVHLLDAAGELVAQHDSEPVNGLRPTSTWRPGESIVDRHGVLLPDDLPSGDYQLVAGLYDPVTGNRLLVTAGTSAPPGDSWPVGTVQVR